MTVNRHQKHKERWGRYGFQNLLAWLCLFLAVRPFLGATHTGVIFTVFLTVVLLSAVYTVSAKSWLLVPCVVLLIISLTLLWLNALNLLHWPYAITAGLLVLYLGVLVYVFSRQLMAVHRVTANVICAALCIYLILGIFWGAIYSMLESLAPGSFAGALLSNAKSADEVAHHLYYFSFITLSTVGYGDITPQTEGAAALCQAEAILGQFFALVMVARLVAIQVSQQTSDES